MSEMPAQAPITSEAQDKETATATSTGASTMSSQAQTFSKLGKRKSPITSSMPMYLAQTAERNTENMQELSLSKTACDKPSPTPREIRQKVASVFAQMSDIEREMKRLEEYTHSQLSEDKPLYQWQNYRGYNDIEQAVFSLHAAVANLEPGYLSEGQARIYCRRAREFSTSTSKSAIFILGHANEKCTTCIDEIEASDLPVADKQDANSRVTGEIAKVLKHCSDATSATWKALDLLEESLLRDVPHATNTTKLEIFSTVQQTSPQPSPAQPDKHPSTPCCKPRSCKKDILILLTILFCIYTLLPPLPPPPHITPDPHTETLTQLAHLETRYTALESSAATHGQRIDSLAAALDGPDEQGKYSVPAVRAECELPRDVRQRVARIEERVEHRLLRLQGEMEQMRRNVNRMDIRLTGRLDRVDR